MGVKYLSIGLFLTMLVIGIIAVNAISSSIKSHSEDDVKININGNEQTLQEAINYSYFVRISKGGAGVMVGDNLLINNRSNSRISVSPSSVKNPGIGSDDVIVNFPSGEMSLTQAAGTLGLCGSIINSSSTQLQGGQHYASEIEVTVGSETKSLQDFVNEGKLLYTTNNLTQCESNEFLRTYDSCNRQERSVDCGVSGYVGNHYCSANGSIYRDYKTKGCSSATCTSSTSADLIFDCKKVNGICPTSDIPGYTAGDCYEAETLHTKKTSNSGSTCLDESKVEQFYIDTCNGDELNRYLCPSSKSTGSKGCLDVAMQSCIRGGGTDTLDILTKTVHCFSP